MSGAELTARIVGAIVGTVGLISLIYVLLTLAQLGKKLGAVTKMRSTYRGYYVAVALVSLALVLRLVRASVFWADPDDLPAALSEPLLYLLLYHLPLAIGITIGLAITWYYWKWLLKER
jgi:chromate transport protein ChrA